MIITDREQFGYPVRHRKKVPFDPEISLTNDIMKLNAEIFQMEAELDRCILSGSEYEEIMADAFASNIHLSTSMEGNPLSHEEVKRLTRRTFRDGPPEETIGFFSQEIFNHIFAYLAEGYSKNWDIETIAGTHALLLLGDNTAEPGEFRKVDGVVITDQGVEVFIGCPPGHVSEEIASLITWLNTKANALLPVVAAAVFFHEFESIHPFKDGNGRVGRTLFHVLLQYRGLPNSKLCLVEKEIVSDLESYYELLARTDFSGDYTKLISDFTRGVWKSYKDAVERIKEKDLLRSDLDEMTKRIIIESKRYKDSFDLKTARSWLPDESEFRVRDRLNQLVKLNVLRTFGRTRGKVYIFNDPVVGWILNNIKEIFGPPQ